MTAVHWQWAELCWALWDHASGCLELVHPPLPWHQHQSRSSHWAWPGAIWLDSKLWTYFRNLGDLRWVPAVSSNYFYLLSSLPISLSMRGEPLTRGTAAVTMRQVEFFRSQSDSLPWPTGPTPPSGWIFHSFPRVRMALRFTPLTSGAAPPWGLRATPVGKSKLKPMPSSRSSLFSAVFNDSGRITESWVKTTRCCQAAHKEWFALSGGVELVPATCITMGGLCMYTH